MSKTRTIRVFDHQTVFDPSRIEEPFARYTDIEEPWIPDVEKAHEIVVGRYYRVPCTLDVHSFEARGYSVSSSRSARQRLSTIVPIIGPLAGRPYRRFQQPLASVIVPDAVPYALQAPGHPAFNDRGGNFKGWTIRRTLRCKRLFSEFPSDAPWLEKLEHAFRDAQACNNVCPHRGISLKGVDPDSTGDPDAVVCPGHGLCWNKRDGRLIPRTGMEKTFNGVTEKSYPRN